METPVTENDYPYIRAWGRMIGSYNSYIQLQVEQARQDGAPDDAIHKKDDGSWSTTDEITSSTTRRQLGLEPLPPRPPEAATILDEIHNTLRWSTRLRDLFGLYEVEPIGEQGLRIHFAGDYVMELELHAQGSEQA
jgi:hypothetical protein